mmetsp:Transcript_5236/g.4826  ORF Transcript_5236/g.4826 Transcript_5236/m.4826 type:complete len:146 (+) Transcript_5236:1038-1475(+)
MRHSEGLPVEMPKDDRLSFEELGRELLLLGGLFFPEPFLVVLQVPLLLQVVLRLDPHDLLEELIFRFESLFFDGELDSALLGNTFFAFKELLEEILGFLLLLDLFLFLLLKESGLPHHHWLYLQRHPRMYWVELLLALGKFVENV